MRIASFFSGCGSLDLGVLQALKLAGIEAEHILLCENNRYARTVLKRHFPDVYQHPDVKLPVSGSADMVIGGFPCQDLSRGNCDRKGLKGKKSGLFYDLCNRIKELDPKYLLLENVDNILINEYLTPVLTELHSMGFTVEYTIISAQEVGAPIKRSRWFAFCHKSDEIKYHHFLGVPLNRTVITLESARYPKHGILFSDGSLSEIKYPSQKTSLVIWPAPIASCRNYNEPPESWLNRAARCYSEKGISNGIPLPLAVRIGDNWRIEYTKMKKDPKLITSEKWSLYKNLSIDWVDRLMGLPSGYTKAEGKSNAAQINFSTSWGKKWDRGHRLKKKQEANQSQRLRLLGNLVVPQQVFNFARKIIW